MNQPKVFLSHSHLDIDIIMKVFNQLQAVGISCWIDRFGIGQNQVITEEVETAIKSSDILLCYLTANSLNSDWVVLEIDRAIQLNKEVYFFIDKDANRTILDASIIGQKFDFVTKLRIPKLYGTSENFYPPILEFVSKLWSKINKIRYPNVELEKLLGPSNEIGLTDVKYGRFTKQDDDKLSHLIRNSKNIKFFGFNGSSFTQRFADDFVHFFSKDKTEMNVLMAKPKSEFYDDNTYLVSKEFHRKPSDWQAISNTRLRLKSYCKEGNKSGTEQSRVNFRHFNSQLRGILFIFDNTICQYTLNLPPVESFNSITLELKAIPSDYNLIKMCIKHFESVWDVSVDFDDEFFN